MRKASRIGPQKSGAEACSLCSSKGPIDLAPGRETLTDVVSGYSPSDFNAITLCMGFTVWPFPGIFAHKNWALLKLPWPNSTEVNVGCMDVTERTDFLIYNFCGAIFFLLELRMK